MKRWICLLAALCLLPLAALGADGEASVSVPEGTVIPWTPVLISFTLPRAETADLVLADETGKEVFAVALDVQGVAGQNTLYWNGTRNHAPAPAGTWTLRLEAGAFRAETPIAVGLSAWGPTGPREGFTPSYSSPFEGRDPALSYWTLPMDISDEEAVWQVLTAPITVVDNGKGEKAQIMLREAPSPDSRGLGSITCATQGVHVLERGEEWSLVECYSSSFHDSPILNWNALVQGYVLTEYLQEIVPSQEMGMVIDKLTQRLYIFREGRLFTTLMVSTGLSNRRQPYNETRSGEFLLTSKVGDFKSDNMICGKAIRFNKGDLLHEVPYILGEDGRSRNYSSTEGKLGRKASHGCIRVQRKETPEGVNMNWIWANLRKNSRTRLLIWEDWQGRQIAVPADDTLLYCNPENGRYYHSAETCRCAPDLKMQPFTYGELDEEPFSRMKRCEWCAPALRRAEIEEINAAYAPGGDHDPVLTEARKKCPRAQR